jgi:hypothetical protein
MRDGDRVVSINALRVNDWPSLRDEVADHPGEPILIVVDREDREMTLTVTPTSTTPPRISIGPPLARERPSLPRAIYRGLKWPLRVHWQRLRGLMHVLRGSEDEARESEVAGPVGIVHATRAVDSAPLGDALAFAATFCSYVLWIALVLAAALYPRGPG